MKYLKFILVVTSIPIALLALAILHGFYWVFDVTQAKTRIRGISFCRKVYLHIVCAILGLRIQNFLSARISSSPHLTVANHHSFIDIFILGREFNGWFLAKSEVRDWPLVGLLARLSGVVFVDRSDIGSRVRAIHMLQKLSNSGGVCVFPEGTTTPNIYPDKKDWAAGSFASVAKNPNALIASHAISYEDHKFHAWIGDQSFLTHLFQVCSISFHNVYVTTKQYTKEELPKRTRETSTFVRTSLTKHCLSNHAMIQEELKRPNTSFDPIANY
jgi:1-acyl-sn-glycerol-3-phosphate acyltransferase